MSVTTAIENISNHLKNAYNELQGLGADLTNVNKNIENISMILDNIYDSMPQVSGEGTSLTLDNTRVGKIKSTLKGNTSQSGTPTPDYPQEIQVVTGDNTIIVSNSDNTQSQNYHVSLGNIELCKIGNYQDRIYKDNGKWYIEKQIGKVVLNGSESWGSASSIASGTSRFWYQNNNVFNSKIEGDLSKYVVSYSFKGISWQGMYYDNTITKNAISNYTASNMTGGRIQIRIDNTIANDVSTFKTWLSTHNTTVYYVLATPTNTEITDQTLIVQLDNFEKAKSYNNQTNISQENNDLPFIINATALMGNSD